MAYDNNNSGMLARNDRKQQPTHPDFTGQCEVNGVPMWISAWTKDGKPGSKMAGKRFFSLSFKPKDQQAHIVAPPVEPPSAPQENLDEDVPF
jgi:hypothetical protein